VALERALAAGSAASQADSRAALAMAEIREELAAHTGEIQAAIAAQPLTVKVTHVDPKTGIASTCDRRDIRYRELFNAAVRGDHPPTAPTGDVLGAVPR